MNSRLLVSIVLPVYNQSDHVSRVVQEYARALSQIAADIELILVPNGCADSSNQVCQEEAQRMSNVRVIPLKKGGWGRAVRAGLKAANGELLCYTNLARTSPEVLVLAILHALNHQDSVTKTCRKVRDSLWRRMGSLLYNLECRALFDLPFWDINGTPKVFPRKFSKLLSLGENDDLIDAEFCLCCRENDYPVLEIPVVLGKRHGGKTTTSHWTAARLYIGALMLWFSVRRELREKRHANGV